MTDDLLTPENLKPLLGGAMFREIHHFTAIDSTNSAAMQAAAAGAEEGSVFIAEQQHSGRGRGGHSWHSAPGTGIYVSVVLRPKLSPGDVLWLSLIAGLSAHEAIESVVSVAPDLRWPNDIMFGQQKLGGILTELNADVHRVNYAVVGIGINVNQAEFPADIRELATSLRIETDREWPRVEITAALLKSVDREYRALNVAGHPAAAISSITERFEKASSYARGAQVRVDEDGGYSGRTVGLDARGFLRVESAAGLKTVLSGGVRKLVEK
ncbi:MAG: Biotin--acetyl-CoA-carboxylase ligase [Acidobacteriales bacterium]|nr:Biotin--acetyl-CoA-carboxylase ligase [Terriglobales bacterium]